MSVEFDPIMAGPIVAIPEGFTIYDKIKVNQGSMTFTELFSKMKAEFKIDVSMVSSGRMALYNAYMGPKQKLRLVRKIEEVYLEIMKGEPFPEGRNYIILDLGGETEEGEDFSMPQILYYFK